MNKTDLETFIQVAETASTSEAARRLHVSQPAVSRRIQSLEDTLPTNLFDRVGKRLQLNHAGRIFLPQAKAMMAAWRHAQRELADLSDAVTGTLHLATSHHIGLHRLSPVLREFRSQYPHVQLNIIFEDSEITHEMVRDGRLDLSIATLDPRGSEDLATETIWHDPLVFVAQQIGQYTLSELADQACVLPGTSTYTGRIILNRFKASGIDLQPAMSTNYLETIHMLVGVGVGWSVLPQTMQAGLEALTVTDLDEPLSRSLGMVTYPDRALSAASRAFQSVLRDYADIPS